MREYARLALACGSFALLALTQGCGGCGGGGNGDIDATGTGIDASVPDAGGGGDDAATDANTTPIMSIVGIFPEAASRRVTTDLTVSGFNLAANATLTLTNCDTTTAYDLTPTVAVDGRSMTATLEALTPVTLREQGLYTVTVTNPDDGQTDELACAFRIVDASPPTVTNVVPATAYRGIAGDGVNSDTTVAITGTGFESTPSVRWVKTDGTRAYDALFVGFQSDTQLTAVAPSETLAMDPGEYDVFVTNPDLLAGEWMVDDGAGGTIPGIFTVTTVPPPDIVDVNPSRIQLSACGGPITISGGNFVDGATVWYVAPSGTTCAGSIVDANGDTLCPLVVDSVDPAGTSIVAHFASCPTTGPYPLVVINPDNQADYFFSIEITPSSDGHLNTGAFEMQPSRLFTARWKHAAAFGFDSFGASHMYVAGGQDAGRNVLATVEASQLDIYGNLGPFELARQYGSPSTPRVDDTLSQARQGLTLVRTGHDLFAIGGAGAPTDQTGTTVAALSSVERARILSYAEMPAIGQPTTAAGSLPTGSWYYQVSAVGPWGESLASREVVALHTGGAVQLCWNPPATAGATGYNVYRSLASDGRSGSAIALAYEVAGPCFTDDGTETLTPAPGHLRGVVAAGGALAAGDHAYRVSAVITLAAGGTFETPAGYASTVALTADEVAAGDGSIQLAWDPIANATYRLYKWDGAGYAQLDTGGDLAAATFTDAGAAFLAPAVAPIDGVRPLAPGSLSRWTAAPAMTVAREGVDGVAIQMDPATSGGVVARILVAGGRTSSAGTGTYLTSAESLGLHDDGTLDAAWTPEAPTFVHPRAYYALLTTQGRQDTPFPPPPDEPPCGDLDGDGFLSCNCAPPGTPPDQLDCNDADPTIHPGAPEVCGDGIDQDCDQGCTGTDLACSCTTDVDQDNHLAGTCGGDDCCDTGADTSLGCTDQTAPGIHPGATEACGNGIDEDCDGIDPPCQCSTDTDADGHVSTACGGDDCCDTGADTSIGCTDTTAPGIHPGAPEACNSGVDSNCDGSLTVCVQSPTPSLARLPIRGDATTYAPAPRPRRPRALVGTEPVYVVAVAGDDAFAVSNNAGRADFEACLVDHDTGHLACPTTWVVQSQTDTKGTFGADALLYFSYMYYFYGVNSETTAATLATRTFINSAIGRFPVADLVTVVAGQIFQNRQSASTSFQRNRSYYQMLRLLSYVYVVGGWGAAYSDITGTYPEGPTDMIERHQQ